MENYSRDLKRVSESHIFFKTREVKVDSTPLTDLMFSIILLSSVGSLASTLATIS